MDGSKMLGYSLKWISNFFQERGIIVKNDRARKRISVWRPLLFLVINLPGESVFLTNFDWLIKLLAPCEV